MELERTTTRAQFQIPRSPLADRFICADMQISIPSIELWFAESHQPLSLTTSDGKTAPQILSFSPLAAVECALPDIKGIAGLQSQV